MARKRATKKKTVAKKAAAKKTAARKNKTTTKKAPVKKTAAKPAEEARIDLTDLFSDAADRQWAEEVARTQQAFIQNAREAYLRRGMVLYLGAGVSCAVGLPSWQQLIESLTVTMMSRQVTSAVEKIADLDEEQKPAAIARLQEEVQGSTDTTRPVLVMARAIKETLGHRLPGTVALTIYRPILRDAGGIWKFWQVPFLGSKKRLPLDSVPAIAESKLFAAIADLARAQRDVRGLHAIVNFNYDDLIDEWLRERKIRCDTIRSGEEEVRDSSLPCFHVHGVLPFKQLSRLWPFGGILSKKRPSPSIIGNFVFSEDEYHTEYSDAYRWSNMTMMNQLSRHTGLFVGLSLEDPNLRRLLDVTHRQYPDRFHYAILTRRKRDGGTGKKHKKILDNLFEKVERESFESIGVRVIWTDSYDQVPQTIQQISNLDAASVDGDQGKADGG